MRGNHVRTLSEKIDIYSSSYNNFIILDDFKIEMESNILRLFVYCINHGLKSLMRQPTCYKSPSNPTCICLILTNSPQKLQSACVLETGLSDFHLIAVTVMRKILKKLKHRAVNYWSYTHFSNEASGEYLLHELFKEVLVNNDDGLQRFCDININILNRHAPRKR